MKLKRGDNVMVISGNNKGKTGIIDKILVNTNNNFETGDFVIIEETKPISKNISFVIKEKVI